MSAAKPIATETVEWFAPSEVMPDAEITVLIEVPDDEGCPEVHAGYFDGDETWYELEGPALDRAPLSWAHVPWGGRAWLAELASREGAAK